MAHFFFCGDIADQALMVWLSSLLFLALNVENCSGRRLILNSDQEDTVNISSITRDTHAYFFVQAQTNPSYIMGSTNIEICVQKNCDFELEFYPNENEIFKEVSIWLNTMKKLQSWSYLLFAKQSQLKCKKATGLSPFEDKIFTVKFHDCDESQTALINIEDKVFEYKCAIYMVLGLLLFFNASSLSKSVVFYYSSGTALGIIASSLLFVFVLSRFLPKKPVAYTAMLGGWSFCAYLFSKVWLNLIDIVTLYYPYVIAYVCATGFLTFAYCYHRGPITNPRTHKVLQWSIEILSSILVYHGTQLPKASILLIISLLILQYGFDLCCGAGRTVINILRRIIPFSEFILGPRYKPRKLLSQDEYQQQGRQETEKALEELRKFCQSPECSPWKTLSRIETPKRFARFVEGESHVSAQEITLYEEDMSEVFEIREAGDSFISEDDDSLDPLNLESTSKE